MRNFFFAPESPRVTALIRILLGATLLCDALANWRYAVELYSTFGPPMPIFIRQLESETDSEQGQDSAEETRPSPIRAEPLLRVPVPGPMVAVAAQTLLVFALLSMTLGWRTRTSLVTAILLSLWLGPLDLPGTFAKHSVIALHLQVLLLFSCSGAVYSIDALLSRPKDRCQLASACLRRLMQFLVCFIYLGAAITKMKTPAFMNGDLLTFSLIDDHWGASRLGLWLSTVPHVPLLLSLAIVFYEMLFPALIWVRRCRLPLLGLAIVVHTAMWLVLNLGTFSLIIFAALLSFVEERDLRRFRALFLFRGQNTGNLLLPRLRFGLPSGALEPDLRVGTDQNGLAEGGERSWRALGGALHLAAAIVFMAAGCALQWYNDWYGAFGRRAPAELAEIAKDDFQEMLAQRPLAYEDYFHRIELGSRVSGNQMFGSPRLFRHGQRAWILGRLVRPHPAFEWEGLLIAPDGREAARFTRQVDREALYVLNGFELTRELPPGTYRVILQADGFVVIERKFELRE